MTFKRPCWLLMFISLAFFWVGFASWMLGNPEVKDEQDFRFWFYAAGVLLILFGAIGFLASLLWMIFEVIISGVRSLHQKH